MSPNAKLSYESDDDKIFWYRPILPLLSKNSSRADGINSLAYMRFLRSTGSPK